MENEVLQIQEHFLRPVFQRRVIYNLETNVDDAHLNKILLIRRVKRAAIKFDNFSIPYEHQTDSQKLYDEISSRITDLTEVSFVHLQVSRASTISQMIAFIILLDGSDDWTPELYGKMAQLFSSISNVESADVPVALKVPNFY